MATIEELNNDEARQYIGGVVLVSVLMVVGIVGNIHVLIVYSIKMKPSNHRIFILALAVLDLITCSVGMPFILVDLRNPLTFTMTSACKVLRFINYFICASSALVLLVIAVERYRKICVPLGRQISRTAAKVCCVLVLVVALIVSWPAPVLYGASIVHIEGENITGIRCYTEDRFKNTKHQAYFNSILILIVFGVFIVLVVLYSLIGRVILRHAHFSSNTKTDTAEPTMSGSTSDTKETSASASNLSDVHIKLQNEVPLVSNVTISGSGMDAPPQTDGYTVKNKHNKTRSEHKTKEPNKFNKMRNTTYMLFIITVVFFCSYFPHLILKIITFANNNFVPNMSFGGKVFYNTFIWCFFINNMANPIIYGFCDERFRREVFIMYRNVQLGVLTCFRQT